MSKADGKIATLIQPDISLQSKLKDMNFKIDRGAIDRAVAAGEQFIAERGAWFKEEIHKLHEYHARQPIEGALSAHAVDRILRIAYEARGNGATFGYNLITRIAASLTRFMESRKLSASHRNVIDLHIDAIKDVADAGLKGDGGARGQALLERLAKAVADTPSGDAPPPAPGDKPNDKDAPPQTTEPVKWRRPVEDKDPTFFEKRIRSLIENYDQLDRSNGVPDSKIAEFHATIEDLIDQAPTYNYTLIADVGDLLLKLLDSGPIDAGRTKFLDAHMGCLNMAVNRKMRGAVDSQGKMLLANLRRMAGS